MAISNVLYVLKQHLVFIVFALRLIALLVNFYCKVYSLLTKRAGKGQYRRHFIHVMSWSHNEEAPVTQSH